MKILVVNAYGVASSNPSITTKQHGQKWPRGRRRVIKDHEFVVFCRMITLSLDQINQVLGFKQPIPPQCHIVSATNLHGLLVDWENEVLDESARTSALLFDSFDCVFIGSGSKKVLPWDTSLIHLGRLMHMCNKTGKPCFTIGCAAWLEVTTLALQGKRIHVLNGYRGSRLEKLPSFPIFSNPGSLNLQHASFLDNETGDLYDYDRTRKEWTPCANVGLRIKSESGEPTSDRFAPPERCFLAGGGVREDVEAITVVGDISVRLEPRYLTHPILNGLDKQFILTALPEWHIHRYGSLPHSSQARLEVLAESKAGPVLLVHQLKTIIVAVISDKTYGTIEKIMSNFVRNLAQQIHHVPKRQNRLGTLLTTFLFGGGPGKATTFNRHRDVLPCLSAMGAKPVPSILPNGPHEVPLPSMEAFSHRPEATMARTLESWQADTDASEVQLSFAATEGATAAGINAKSPSLVRQIRLAGVCQTAQEDPQAVLVVAEQAAAEANAVMMLSPIKPIGPAPSARKKVPVPGITGWEKLNTFSGPSQTVPLAAATVSTSQTARFLPSAEAWLPTRHPVTYRETSTSTPFIDTSSSALGSPASPLSPRATPHLVFSPVKKSFCNYRKYQRMAADAAATTSASSNFPSSFSYATGSATAGGEVLTSRTDGVYLSSHERALKDEAKAKEKFVHPEKKGFRLTFGKQSEIPLRHEGQVRGQGAYPDFPKNQGFEHMLACDFDILRVEDRKKHLYGHWKKV